MFAEEGADMQSEKANHPVVLMLTRAFAATLRRLVSLISMHTFVVLVIARSTEIMLLYAIERCSLFKWHIFNTNLL